MLEMDKDKKVLFVYEENKNHRSNSLKDLDEVITLEQSQPVLLETVAADQIYIDKGYQCTAEKRDLALCGDEIDYVVLYTQQGGCPWQVSVTRDGHLKKCSLIAAIKESAGLEIRFDTFGIESKVLCISTGEMIDYRNYDKKENAKYFQ